MAVTPRKISLVVLLALCTIASANYMRVCYHTNWAQYRPGRGKFLPEQIDPFLCTHVIYAFAKIGPEHKLRMYEWNDDIMYPRTLALKQKKSGLENTLGCWWMES